MLTRPARRFQAISLLTTIAIFASTATLAAAAGKSKPAHINPLTIPTLKITPLKGKPNAPLTITGTRFAASKKLHTEIDCPQFAKAKHGSWSYSVHTNAKGAFTLRTKFPTLKKAKSGICNFYVLNTPKKSASWVSTNFTVT